MKKNLRKSILTAALIKNDIAGTCSVLLRIYFKPALATHGLAEKAH